VVQDKEVGDGTTSVVILAAELLKRANDLVGMKIHPTSIISGYRLAQREATKFINDKMSTKTEKLGKEALMNAAKTSMSSKILNIDSDFFAGLAVDSVMHVKTTNAAGEARYPVKAINILKAHGRGSRESRLIQGYGLNCVRASQAMPTMVKGAKIALLDYDLRKFKLSMGVQVVVTDPTKLQAIRDREEDIMKERIEMMIKAGANVILTSKGIDDMCLKYFVEAGAIACRRVKKDDMRRIAKVTGATIQLSMAGMDGEESFDASLLGSAEKVYEERVGDNEMLVIEGCASHKSCSILLRGANEYTLDEMERALHDAMCVVKRVLESGNVVPGGGAVESALSIYLDNFATTLSSREQMAIAEFSEALLVIPKTLAVNAACDATELVAKLRADHNFAQTDPAKYKDRSNSGLNLIDGKIQDSLNSGVIEPAMSKVKMLGFATEAAITILRIDDMVKAAPMQQEGQ
jgi:T-complex protein 1 subunit alpha